MLLDTPAATPRSYRVLVRLADFAPREPGQVAHPAAQCGLLGGCGGRRGWGQRAGLGPAGRHTAQVPAGRCAQTARQRISPASRTASPARADNGSGSGGGGRWVYTLHLVLEDATAQLDALLFGPDAEAFFADLPARDFGADPAAAAEVQRRLHTLLGVGCQRCAGLPGRLGCAGLPRLACCQEFLPPLLL